MPVSLVDASRLTQLVPHEYSVLIMTGGSYASYDEPAAAWLREYVKQGGTLVATTSAITVLQKLKVVSGVLRSETTEERSDPVRRRPYDQASQDKALKLISGAILRGRVDRSHPLGYGFSSVELPLFRNHNLVLNPAKGPYSTPVIYDEDPVMSGYVSARNQQRLAGSAAAHVAALGRGRMILLADDPNFRAFWFGSSRLLINSLFFGPLVKVP